MVLTTHGDASALADQTAAVAEYNSKFATASPGTASQSQTSSGTAAPATSTEQSARTGARPQFIDEERPVDVYQLHSFPEDCITPLAQLEGENEFLG